MPRRVLRSPRVGDFPKWRACAVAGARESQQVLTPPPPPSIPPPAPCPQAGGLSFLLFGTLRALKMIRIDPDLETKGMDSFCTALDIPKAGAPQAGAPQAGAPQA